MCNYRPTPFRRCSKSSLTSLLTPWWRCICCITGSARLGSSVSVTFCCQ